MKNRQCLNFIFFGIVYSLILLEGYARPQQIRRQDFGKYVNEYTRQIIGHIGFKPDYEKLNLPNLENQNFNFTNNGSGNYYFTFSGDGVERSEVGELKNPGTDNELQAVKGQYTYTFEHAAGKGKIIVIIGYTADENGFQPFLIRVEYKPKYIAAFFSPAPIIIKEDIATACLASLCGGNIG